MRTEGSRCGFPVSHPCDRNKSQGWGTGHFVEELAPDNADPSDPAQDEKLIGVGSRAVRI
jgi:hypothetical protein